MNMQHVLQILQTIIVNTIYTLSTCSTQFYAHIQQSFSFTTTQAFTLCQNQYWSQSTGNFSLHSQESRSPVQALALQMALASATAMLF